MARWKQVGQFLSFHFCSYRQKIAFLGKVQVFQLHLCPYRFDLEDERPDDEISSFFLLLWSHCHVTIRRCRTRLWPVLIAFVLKTNPHCCNGPFSDTQRKIPRNVDKCNTMSTPNNAITTVVTTTNTYEYTEFLFRTYIVHFYGPKLGMGSLDLMMSVFHIHLRRLLWMYCLRHAWVKRNDRGENW